MTDWDWIERQALEARASLQKCQMPPEVLLELAQAAKVQAARIVELEAERPRFSQRQFVQALRDRDEAQSRAAELAERCAELEGDAQMWRSAQGMFGKSTSSRKVQP